MDILIKAAQLILSLSILVVLHEMGHFFPAKWFKTRVEKFYLFFNPGFSIAKFKKGETEYGIGWLPLGGYVKIAGMIDESMDTEAMKEEPKPWEFRSKPAWQRLIIMIGGVVVNLILGFVIYAGVLFAWGEEYVTPQNATYGLAADSLMQTIGFQDGDRILSYVEDGETIPLKSARDINTHLLLDDLTKVTLEREGTTMALDIPEDMGQQLIDNGVRGAFTIRIPFVVDSITPEKGAANSDLKKGDQLLAVDGVAWSFAHEFTKAISANIDEEIELTVLRDGSSKKIKVNTNEKGQIGIYPKTVIGLPEFIVTKKEYSLLEAIPAGFNKSGRVLRDYAVSMKFLLSPAGRKQTGGFIAIGNMFPAQWDWQIFWLRTALLSLILAFMNILPIPALDGGHVMFLLYEIIAGRKPGDKFMERAQITGFVILIVLMLLVNGNDFYKWITGQL